MQVLKFGGSSVANAENINKVIEIIQHAIQKDTTLVAVSALSGITDTLLQCGIVAASGNAAYKDLVKHIEARHLETAEILLPAAQGNDVLDIIKKCCNEIEGICNGVFLLGELSNRIKDKIVSYGELLSSQMICAALVARDTNAAWKDSRELITTDAVFCHAAVDFPVTEKNILNYLQNNTYRVIIFPGFIAADKTGATTTLGRGGSDYTAAILAKAINAAVLEIWTDVSGMMTADPRLVTNAKIIPQISYQEAMELSHFGAKVIYPPTIQPVMVKAIPTWIKNTFSPQDAGTLIQNQAIKNGSKIRGISSINKVTLLSLEGSGMVGIPGFSKRLFEALSDQKINVIFITQGSSEHSICVGVDETEAAKAKEAVDMAFVAEITSKKVEPLIIENNLAIIALVGDDMKNHPGICGKMFAALGRNGVNVRAIAQGSSEKNISAVVAETDVKKAINILHEDFFETTYKQINLFIAGTGNVGKRLLAQLQQQQQYLQQNLRLNIKVVGLASSKKMLINEEGISLDNWEADLQNGEPMKIESFVNSITSKNLRNTVFADVTASDIVAGCYQQLFEKSVSVVACNKIACSSPYANYRQLKDKSREYNSLFLFETNVGAGLPIIGTLNDLLRSGDAVTKMEAVLSGTLNYVFNNYDGEKPFAAIVKQAQDEGYTEPDPRLDLSGTDVMRKIMILAREAGEKIEMENIENISFMPPACMQGTVADFYAAMEKHEEHFKQIFLKAKNAGAKLKFVATYENGKAKVGLQHIDPKHDLYHLYGKDNVVLFYTKRYVDQPLVVKGAGAGAEVTASGVFADIIRAARV